MLKLKIYDGAKPNTKQIRLRTNGYEKVNLEFMLSIYEKIDEVKDSGYEVEWEVNKVIEKLKKSMTGEEGKP